MTEYEMIVLESSGPIARITLNRPDAANAMNDTLLRELADAAKRCDRGASKVVVLTGAGRFFSAGGDLRAMASSSSTPGDYVKAMADDLHRAISTFARMDAVLITAVNGIAAGAGCSLAVTGDLVIAAESASFTMAYATVGLSPDGGSSFSLPRLIGVRRTQELLLTNRELSAAEALAWGLVTEVVKSTEVAARADALAEKVASGAGQSTAAVKKLVLTSFKTGLEEQMELEGRLIAECADSRDGNEGINAFLEKRRPQFAH
ncbi:enoyl-CoA hydratase/isomerase family protein [Mycobacterium camsae]|uniref:enoyl-CoA hydratase/isomerase family protein n=1 Tax=Mycobacterium gordonae TaxID=1778 RepID=UPI001980F639|nr:enoyl-CoA hydratase/isomerase family protein [Mycobacterium gordonae]